MSDLSVPVPTATQVPLATPRAGRGRAKPVADRSATLVEVWLRAHTGLVFAFLFLPIVIVVIFSFNDTTRRVTDWDGFGLRWYQFVLADRAIQRYLINSVIVGVATGVIATVFGTMAALGFQRAPRWFRVPFDAITYVSVIVPELVIALATLVFFASTIGRDGDRDAGHRDGDRVRLPHDRERGLAVQHQPGAAARPGPAVRHGPDDGRGQLRPVRDALANLLADHVPAAPAGHRRRIPPVVHVCVRRLPDHDVRERPWDLDASRCTCSGRSARG